MIKNNIRSILLVLCSFFWAYFTFSYIDAQKEEKEQANILKYEQSIVEKKSKNQDSEDLLPWAEIERLVVWEEVEEENIQEQWEEMLQQGSWENTQAEENNWTTQLWNSQWEGGILDEETSEEIVEKEWWAIDTLWTEATGTDTLKESLLSVFSREKTNWESESEGIISPPEYNPLDWEEPSDIKEKRVFPESLNTSMNFHSQSPFGTWGEIFWETCEEASVLLAFLYFEWITVTATEFRDELLRLVDYQNEIFWDFKHTTVAQTAEILRDYYKYDNYEILENPSVEDLKYNIAKGSIILAPFYGVGLNPNYSWIGPEYHFMVLKWYTKDTFIAHDVGTKKWANYEYPISTIMERIHDYHPESVQLWAKRVIVVSPN
jgi:hypothetical protein